MRRQDTQRKGEQCGGYALQWTEAEERSQEGNEVKRKGKARIRWAREKKWFAPLRKRKGLQRQ